MQHYNKDDILKNKIANTEKLKKIDRSTRKLPSLQAKKNVPKDEYADDFI